MRTTVVSPLPAARESHAQGHEHLVQFYESDDFLVRVVTDFLRPALATRDPVIIIATESHRRAFSQRLAALGADVEGAIASGQLQLLDAHEALTGFMVGALPDPERFEATLGAKVAAVSGRPNAKVRAYGEMVDLLWRDGNSRGALQLEGLWNSLQRRHSFSLLCAYVMASFYNEAGALAPICATHTHVLPSTGDSASLATGAVALAAEIAQRKEIEHSLKRAVTDLHHREEELRDFVENANIGMHWVGADGEILWANQAELDLLGYSRDEYVGRSIADFHVDAEAIETVLARLRAREALAGHEVQLRAKNGEIKHVELSSSVLWRDGKFVHTRCFMHDLTERKRLGAQREAQALRSERLATITAGIADAVADEDVVTAVVDHVAAAITASSAALFVLEPDGASMRLKRAAGYSDSQRTLLATVPLRPGTLPAVDCCLSGTPVWLESQGEVVERYPHLSAVVSPDRAYRVACLPVMVQGKTRGSLAFTFDGVPALDEDHRSLLQIVAGHCGQALERLRLLESERASRDQAEAAARRLAVLDRASRAFTLNSAALPALLQSIVEQVTAEVADAAGLALMPPQGGEMQLVAVSHRDPEQKNVLQKLFEASPTRAGAGLAGRVLETGQTLFVPDLDPAMTHASYRAWVERERVRSLIVVPLRANAKVFGVLWAVRRSPLPAFVDGDRMLLEELGDRASLAIDANRLQLDNERARERAELLYTLAASVIGAERIEQVFEVALTGIERALGAKRSAILQYDPDGVMRFKQWRGLSDDYRRAVEGHSPWARDVKAPEPIFVPDTETDASLAPYAPTLRTEGIRSLGFVPLFAGKRLLGKFMVYYDAPRSLSSEEVELAKAIADHVAGAIARFTTLDELRDTVRYNELFTGVLAHDLRNPLGAILTSAHLMLRRLEGDGDKLTKPLGRVMNSGERMARMIDQLLDFTRARVGGGFRLEARPFNLGDSTQQVIDELESARPEWSIGFESHGDTSGSWDADRLTQVISNLLANACHHGTEEAPVMVRVDGRSPDQVVLEVSNSGSIPDALMTSLFDPFRRAKHPRGNAGGLGLGLFITRELVLAHGGTVSVTSNTGKSTVFTVKLPRHCAASAPAALQ